ncbi:nucleoid DNA-binding protein [Paraburkholderia terricola]|nr:nucleoid DNA-binding protein [Paraburkholderia terricola]
MNKQDLIETVAAATGNSKASVAGAIDAIISL